MAGVLLHQLQDLPGDLLQPIHLPAQLRVCDAVVGAADAAEHPGVALLRLLRHLRSLALPLLPFLILRRLMAAEQHPPAQIQIGLLAPQALFQHGLQIPLRPALGYLRRTGQTGYRDAAALACDPQIGGVAPVTAGHGAAADQQSDAAGQQAVG